MITRRGFITSCVAAIPVLGIMVASQRDSTNAQTRPDATPETLRPRWKTALDTTITPDRQRYIVYKYLMRSPFRRAVTLRAYPLVSDKYLRGLGFIAIGAAIPPETFIPISSTSARTYKQGDTLTVIAKVDE